MIEKEIDISLCRQCDLLRIHRSGLYYTPVPETPENLNLMRLIDEQYYKTPFYGIRRITAWLRHQGYQVNRKRIGRNAGFDQPSPEQPEHLTLLIANMVKWSIKIGRRWSLMPAYPLLLLFVVILRM